MISCYHKKQLCHLTHKHFVRISLPPLSVSLHTLITVTQFYWLTSQSRLLTDFPQICLFHCGAVKPVAFACLFIMAHWHDVPPSTSICLLTNTLQDLFMSLKKQPLLRCCETWDTCWQRKDPRWQLKAPLLSWELNTPTPKLTFIHRNKTTA